jgi:hypothetical protein
VGETDGSVLAGVVVAGRLAEDCVVFAMVGDDVGVNERTGAVVLAAVVVGGGFKGSISVWVLLQAVGIRQTTTSTKVINQQYFWNLGILVLPNCCI